MFSEKENVLFAGHQMQSSRAAGFGKLAPKTPNPAATRAIKTPFHVKIAEPENQAFNTKKTSFYQEASKLATPIGPRRVPLGGKTTNARARFSSGKGKLQFKEAVALPQADIDHHNEDHEYPEPEYMPPKALDLPDLPEDYREPDFELMKAIVFAPGVYSAYLEDIDDEGKTKTQRRLAARVKECVEEMLAEADDMLLPEDQQRFKSMPIATTEKKAVPSGTRAKKASKSRSASKTNSRSSSRPTSRLGTTSRGESRPTSRLERHQSGGLIAPQAAMKQRTKSSLSHKRPVSAAPPLVAKQPLVRSTSFSRPVSSTSSSRPGTAGSSSAHRGNMTTREIGGAKASSATDQQQKPKIFSFEYQEKSGAAVEGEEEDILATIKKMDVYKDEDEDKNWEEKEQQEREKILEVLYENEDDFQL